MAWCDVDLLGFLIQFRALFWSSLRRSTLLLSIVFLLIALLYNCLILLTVAMVQSENVSPAGLVSSYCLTRIRMIYGVVFASSADAAKVNQEKAAGCFLSNGQLLQILLG